MEIVTARPSIERKMKLMGFQCAGCSFADEETLRDAAKVHGIPIEDVIEKLGIPDNPQHDSEETAQDNAQEESAQDLPKLSGLSESGRIDSDEELIDASTDYHYSGRAEPDIEEIDDDDAGADE